MRNLILAVWILFAASFAAAQSPTTTRTPTPTPSRTPTPTPTRTPTYDPLVAQREGGHNLYVLENIAHLRNEFSAPTIGVPVNVRVGDNPTVAPGYDITTTSGDFPAVFANILHVSGGGSKYGLLVVEGEGIGAGGMIIMGDGGGTADLRNWNIRATGDTLAMTGLSDILAPTDTFLTLTADASTPTVTFGTTVVFESYIDAQANISNSSTGTVILSGDALVSGGATIQEELTLDGDLLLGGSISNPLGGDLTIDDSLVVTGNITNSTGPVYIGDTQGIDLTGGGGLNFQDDGPITSSSSPDLDFQVAVRNSTGPFLVNDTLQVGLAADFFGAISNSTGDLTIDDNLVVTGTITGTSDLSLDSAAWTFTASTNIMKLTSGSIQINTSDTDRELMIGGAQAKLKFCDPGTGNGYGIIGDDASGTARNLFTVIGNAVTYGMRGSSSSQSWATNTSTAGAGGERIHLSIANGATTVFNEGGVDMDTRFETDGDDYMLFLDGGANKIGISTSSPTSTLHLDGSLALTITSISSTTTAGAHHTILCNATGGAFDVDLPAASTCPGRVYVIKKIDASGNAVSVDPNSSETIDDSSTSYALAAQYDSITIQCDGSEWWILSTGP